jgi:ATP-dependent exoDNAse (exonuclease V) beta subunit
VNNKLVLKASAGTGKTFRLSIEYIRALLEGESFENILVMTFTRKATAEIRERILHFIKEIVNGSPEGQDIEKILKDKYPEVEVDKKLLKEAFGAILRKKEALKIYTIDGFSNFLFKKAVAPHLNIYTYEMIDEGNNEVYYEKILDRIVSSERYFDILKEFFDNNAKKDIDVYIGLIKNIIENRWKFMLVEGIFKQREKMSAGDYLTMFNSIIGDIEEAGKIKCPDKDIWNDGIKTAYKNYSRATNREEQDKFIRERAKKLLEESNFWTQSFIKPTKAAPQTGDIYNRVVDSFERFKEDLARSIYNEEIIIYEEHIRQFTTMVFDLYDSYKFSEKKFTHNDISTYVYKYIYSDKLNLIKEGSCTEYFYQIMDVPISTVFIDEFQDTSILQWKLLKAIVHNAKDVICVGDEKQSIYGWRGGEKELFESLEKIMEAREESMDTSYRSYGAIIDFVNDVFSVVRDSHGEDWKYESVNYLKEKEGGFIQTFLINKDDEATKGSVIVDILKSDIKNYSKVGIIARRKKDLNEIIVDLEEAGIPYITNDGMALTEHRALKGVYSLIKYFAYNEYIYLLEFLRSDIVNIDGRSLGEFLDKRVEVEDFLLYGAKLPELVDSNILVKVKELKDMEIKDYSSNGDRRHFAERLIKDLNITGLFRSNSDLKNIFRFYELLKKSASLEEFVIYVEENLEEEELRQVAVEELNAVKLMTVHKSKGLEFETEFFYADLTKSPNRDRKELKFYLDFDEEFEAVEDYILTNSKYNTVLEKLGYDYSSKEVYKAQLEEMNNLYVALTRAKSNLYLVINTNKDSEKLEDIDSPFMMGIKKAMKVEDTASLDGKSLGLFKESDLLPEENTFREEFDFSELFANAEIDKSLLMENLKIKENVDYKMTIDKEFKRKKGSAVHYYLENIIYDSPSEREYSRKLTINKYGNMFGEKEIEEIIRKSEDFVDNNPDIFDEKWLIKSEYEIYEEVEGQKKIYRIDRLMINTEEKRVLIVDYKTGGKDDKQINKYKEIMRRNLPQDYKIEGKYLFISM